MHENNNAVKVAIPPEFSGARFFSFLLLIGLAFIALIVFRVPEYRGYIDPFYSPTILILPAIALFRLTCYAFRKSYNRHVFTHPLACMVSPNNDLNRNYTGESSHVFRTENLHRYFMYFSVLVLPFFYYDAYISFAYNLSLIRLGSILLLADAVILSLYVFSCHSVRNIIGGNKDCFNCMKFSIKRKQIFDLQSFLNEHHEFFAWFSLAFIVFIDLFIRAMAAFHFDVVLLHL
ncbi:succinate dehydrogenase [Candidatus Marsarchaeota archaeon]|nr:succinate dehydrogenase [Candidatus Marsarchaeota archaeon]